MNSVEEAVESIFNNEKKKVVICGIGEFYQRHKNDWYFEDVNVVAYADSNPEKIKDRKCISYNEISVAEIDYALIMSARFSTQIRANLNEIGCGDEKILTWEQFVFDRRYENGLKSLAIVGKKDFEALGETKIPYKGYDVAAIADNEYKRTVSDGYVVTSLEDLSNGYDKVLILSDKSQEVTKELLLSKGYEKGQICDSLERTDSEKIIDDRKNVIICGCDLFRHTSSVVMLTHAINIVAVWENNPTLAGTKINGVPIITSPKITDVGADYIVCEDFLQKSICKELPTVISYSDFLEKMSNGICKANMTGLVLFGAGIYLKNRINSECFKNFKVKAIIDNDKSKQNTEFNGIHIYSPDMIYEMEYDYIVIMSKAYGEMKSQLIDMGIDEDRILRFHDIDRSNKRYTDKYQVEEVLKEDYSPLVSIVVPNYNHGEYLRQRLDSIYSQTYTNYEVILLDDCSKDNSREILKEYADKHKDTTTTHFNTVNAGKAFLQWQKGIELAKGELIWIAESDDYSDPFFLETLVEKFKQESVMIAFARSVFVKNGEITWTQEEYLHDSLFDWSKEFVLTASQAINMGFAVNNIIPNVSSALFRNIEISQEIKDYWKYLNLCGDWIFYLYIARGGNIAYTNRINNYYRIHEGSTSLNVQKQIMYYDEQSVVSKYIVKNYRCNLEFIESVEKKLVDHYKNVFETDDASEVEKHYCKEEILKVLKERTINIAMACFSMCNGGGETYPLFLANEMHRQGYNVTVFDFNYDKHDENIRRKLNSSIPLVRIKEKSELANVIKAYSIDVIHSHHASVDTLIADTIIANNLRETKHVITLHGMYEAIDEENSLNSIDRVIKTCNKFVYIADKNLSMFKKAGVYDNNMDKFVKMPNGLPQIPISAVERNSLGIGDDDFVLCLVSRAIRAKGWLEAIEAVNRLNDLVADRKIHLLLLGAGEILEECRLLSNEYIHVMGSVNNVRDYFAMADMGILPTMFSGESYPLVLIECLMSGTPMLATDIAEVKNQLTDEAGNLAGELLHLVDGKIETQEIVEKVLKFINDRALLKTLKDRTGSASKKFSIEKIASEYIGEYLQLGDI